MYVICIYISFLALDIALYEEVEAYTGTRPVLVCGVLANQITNLLVESYPKLFHYCHPGNNLYQLLVYIIKRF